MRHLINIINEAILAKPMVDGDNVKVVALSSVDSCDDNLGLITGLNHVCLIWSPEDGNGYMCANGGSTFDDGNEWYNLKDVEKIIGKQKWEKVDTISLGYSYSSTVGKNKDHEITVYSATINTKDINKLYKQNAKTLRIYKKAYSTVTVKDFINCMKDVGYLGY